MRSTCAATRTGRQRGHLFLSNDVQIRHDFVVSCSVHDSASTCILWMQQHSTRQCECSKISQHCEAWGDARLEPITAVRWATLGDEAYQWRDIDKVSVAAPVVAVALQKSSEVYSFTGNFWLFWLGHGKGSDSGKKQVLTILAKGAQYRLANGR